MRWLHKGHRWMKEVHYEGMVEGKAQGHYELMVEWKGFIMRGKFKAQGHYEGTVQRKALGHYEGKVEWRVHYEGIMRVLLTRGKVEWKGFIMSAWLREKHGGIYVME